jgi:hypothetical protein
VFSGGYHDGHLVDPEHRAAVEVGLLHAPAALQSAPGGHWVFRGAVAVVASRELR